MRISKLQPRGGETKNGRHTPAVFSAALCAADFHSGSAAMKRFRRRADVYAKSTTKN
jgi:hypothetical protein